MRERGSRIVACAFGAGDYSANTGISIADNAALVDVLQCVTMYTINTIHMIIAIITNSIIIITIIIIIIIITIIIIVMFIIIIIITIIIIISIIITITIIIIIIIIMKLTSHPVCCSRVALPAGERDVSKVLP